MNPQDRLEQAYGQLEEGKARQRTEARKRAIAKSQEDRLLGGIFIARNFRDLRMRDMSDIPAFARKWARHWRHVTLVVRKYGGISTTRDMRLPEGPSFTIAHELFEQVLAGLPLSELTQQLAEHLSILGPKIGHQTPGENYWGLFAFFEALNEHVLRTVPLFREYPSQKPQAIAVPEEVQGPPSVEKQGGGPGTTMTHRPAEAPLNRNEDLPCDSALHDPQEIRQGAIARMAESTVPHRDQQRDWKKLMGWRPILVALQMPVTEANRKRVKAYQERHGGGPITWLGRTPQADRGALVAWWDGLGQQVQAAETNRKSAEHLECYHDQRDQGLHKEKRPNSKGKIRDR